MANSIFLGRLNAEQRKALIERLWHAQGGKCFITGKEIDLSLHEGELAMGNTPSRMAVAARTSRR
jgi:ribose 1,5-bisphosphokinase PhnN